MVDGLKALDPERPIREADCIREFRGGFAGKVSVNGRLSYTLRRSGGARFSHFVISSVFVGEFLKDDFDNIVDIRFVHRRMQRKPD
jgi:hypothetical protein